MSGSAQNQYRDNMRAASNLSFLLLTVLKADADPQNETFSNVGGKKRISCINQSADFLLIICKYALLQFKKVILQKPWPMWHLRSRPPFL